MNKQSANNENEWKIKKDYSYLLESKFVEKWINTYKNGQQQRLQTLAQFCEFIEKTPEEIIYEHHKDITQQNPLNINNIGKNHIHAFFDYLKGETVNGKTINKPLSHNSARQYAYSKLASFFKKNNVPLTFQKGEVPNEEKGTMDKVWRNGEKRISVDEKKECIKKIKDALKNTRDKTILLSKISSGMDDVDLFNLKYRDYIRGYLNEFNICYIHGNRKKTGVYFQTFLNSEVCTILQTYLKERESRGENLKEDTWLFVSEKATNKGNYNTIKRTAFSENLKSVCETLDIVNVTPKSFRRWFNTELKRNRVDFEVVERMMGHKVGVSMKYQELFDDIDAFVEEYVENIEPFTLLGNGGNKKLTEMDKKVEKVETENKHLRNQLNDLTDLVKAMIRKQEKEIKEKLTLLEKREKE